MDSDEDSGVGEECCGGDGGNVVVVFWGCCWTWVDGWMGGWGVDGLCEGVGMLGGERVLGVEEEEEEEEKKLFRSRYETRRICGWWTTWLVVKGLVGASVRAWVEWGSTST